MGSMREIKQRIHATEKTSQITKAMYMVSASKLKKAERAIVRFRPLTRRLGDSVARVIENDRELSHPIIEARPPQHTIYILVSSDRGLAGPYNASVFKAFDAHVRKYHDSPESFTVAALGYKAFSFAKRRGYTLLNDTVIQVRDDISFLDFREITDLFIKDYLSGRCDRVVVFYNKFINTITQRVEADTIMPLDKDALLKDVDDIDDEGPYKRIYHYEPAPDTVLAQLLPMVVVNMLYGMILEAKASEHAARMTAMKNATDNAKDLIKDLRLHYNRARQDAITIELTDIIGGANAVN
ncbi:MAG: ATP synthase F1 subunit gamma [Acholeplasmatales bacterium]|nr:MAG: ATP synthase F1 subunit gamma [Acholeplasmatales bacterium]